MSNLEQKVDVLLRLAAADNATQKNRAREELRGLMTTASGEVGTAEGEARRVLLEIGVPDHLIGHRCLVTALCAATTDPAILRSVTKVLYPTVAHRCSTSPTRAERAMRHAIEVAWLRGDLDVLRKYFGNTVSPDRGKPTNSEFIARMSNVVRQRLQS